MIFAFAAIVGLGCIAIPVIQGVVRYWRLLDQAERWTKPEDAVGRDEQDAQSTSDDDLDWIDRRHGVTPAAPDANGADVAVERTAGRN
jgi:hypothetical protein